MLKHSEIIMSTKNQIEAELRKKLRNMNNFNSIMQKLTRIKYNKQIHQSTESSHHTLMRYVRNDDNLVMRNQNPQILQTQ